MPKKNFLLGMGAQKSGTSWLHSTLSSSNQVDFGFCKEYHIFDALNIPSCERFYVKTMAQQRSMQKQKLTVDPNSKLGYRLSFLKDVNSYYDYFSDILSKDSVLLTGDITPSYSGLSSEVLRSIKKQFLRRNVDLRVIFLMRDPVERCWSALRMSRKLTLQRNKGFVFDLDEFTHLSSVYNQPNYICRASYDKTLANIFSSFDESECFFGLYEDLFSSNTIDSIFDFLGIDSYDVDFNDKVNPTPKDEMIPDYLAKDIARFYADSYYSAVRLFGKDKISSCWWSSKYVF